MIQPGDEVEVRDIHGNWHQARACSAPRIDRTNAIGRSYYESVSVELPAWEHPVNWPSGDVRLVDSCRAVYRVETT